MDSFVFYESFYKVTGGFNDLKFARVMRALIELSLYEAAPDLPDETENSLVNMMYMNVKAAHERYEKAKEDGAKGGRPRYIPPEEWKAYRKSHSQKETAEHYGISVDTLQRWEKAAKTAKPQNLTVTDTDTVTVTATDTVTSINNNNGSSREPSKGPALPEMKEEGRWLCEPYQIKDGRWAAEFEPAGGESRVIVFDAV